MNRYCKTLTAVLLPLLLAGCGGGGHDPRLERVAAMVSESPRESLAALDSIDTAGLSDSDRAYLALLTVKAGDKAFIPHTTDTVVKSAVEYYSSHPDIGLTPEALYYGGRVYSDMGDYPKALGYFQRALDLLPEGTPDTNLRGNVLSQIGGLLNDLGLYGQAAPYIEKVIEIEHAAGDTLNLALDYKMLGAIQLHLRDYDNAVKSFREAEKWASYVSVSDEAEIMAYEAAVSYMKNDDDAALRFIRPALESIDSVSRNIALAVASKIYLRANIRDTAYMYARELALSGNPNNRKTGYMVMLSPGLRDLVPEDSLDCFYTDYKTVLENQFRRQETNGSLIQNSMYNYSVHDREREKAESAAEVATFRLALAVVFILLLSLVIVLLRQRHRSRIFELYKSIEDLRALNESLSRGNDVPYVFPPGIDEGERLKMSLREQVKSLYEKGERQRTIPRPILESPAYAEISSHIKSGKPIKEDSLVWADLEKAVADSSCKFREHLQLLCGGALRPEDYHAALLIKSGFTPSQMAILFSKTKGSISYRRKKLCVKVLGEDLGTETIDDVMRLL